MDSAAFQALATGRAQAYTTDLPVVLNYAKSTQFGGKYGQAGRAFSAGGNYGIAVRKSSTALKTALKNALGKIRAKGQYDRILKKWGVADAALK